MTRALDQDECYRAISARDARCDGRFFTCVHTTGIFCRPICPARTPKRENCLFVRTAQAALALGFRACRRCRPEVKAGSPAWDLTQASMTRALRLIQDGALDEAPVEGLAERLGIGARHLRRLIKARIGIAPNRLALTRRASFARNLLETTDLPMIDVAEASGFGSLRRFNDVMRLEFGASPTALRAARVPTGGASVSGAVTVMLKARGGLDWPALWTFFAERAIPGMEHAVQGRYVRTLTVGGESVRLMAEAGGTAGTMSLTVEGARPQGLYDIVKRARRAFDLESHAAAIARYLGGDPVLKRLNPDSRPPRLPGAFDPFELSVRALIGQQISVKAARTIAGRIAARFGQPMPGPGPDHGPQLTFPAPADLSRASLEVLMAVGLTRARASALKRLAEAVAGDPSLLTPAASLDAALDRLTALAGIGPWTAHYIALRALGESDAFPGSDLVLRKAYGALTGHVPSERELTKAAEAWRPWRGYAAQYLWNSLATEPHKETPHDLASGNRQKPARAHSAPA